jgi:succinyldiaminopimelate transaminase
MIPEIAYPTYAVGALLSGAEVLASDSTIAAGPADVGLVWLNSPANPTGRVLPVNHLRKVLEWARERGAVVAADECYLEYVWDDSDAYSLLDPRVNGGSLDSLLVVHSLSKRSNMAGYRGAFVVGDPEVVSALREARRHSGLMVSAPVQAAMTVALGDQAHVDEQRERYRRRRALVRSALISAGFVIDHSEASLYLWATRDESCMETVGWFAERGVLVAPGDFYGPAGARHVRVALTATDERIASACARLS